MSMKSIFLVLLSGLLLASCSGLDHPVSLESTSWELYSYRNTFTKGGRPITLIFENGQVRGSAGCNSYGGDYREKGDRIVFENIFATMMACLEPEGVMDHEQSYLQFLAEVETFRISGGELQLLRPDGEAMTFIPKRLME